MHAIKKLNKRQIHAIIFRKYYTYEKTKSEISQTQKWQLFGLSKTKQIAQSAMNVEQIYEFDTC